MPDTELHSPHDIYQNPSLSEFTEESLQGDGYRPRTTPLREAVYLIDEISDGWKKPSEQILKELLLRAKTEDRRSLLLRQLPGALAEYVVLEILKHTLTEQTRFATPEEEAQKIDIVVPVGTDSLQIQVTTRQNPKRKRESLPPGVILIAPFCKTHTRKKGEKSDFKNLYRYLIGQLNRHESLPKKDPKQPTKLVQFDTIPLIWIGTVMKQLIDGYTELKNTGGVLAIPDIDWQIENELLSAYL